MASNSKKPIAVRSIRIDADVYAHIEKHTERLNDTPNAVLRRLFNLDKATPKKAATKS